MCLIPTLLFLVYLLCGRPVCRFYCPPGGGEIPSLGSKKNSVTNLFFYHYPPPPKKEEKKVFLCCNPPTPLDP